jgi:NodT family efflux transporter outer membrane factor (OMF) lipoprotein
MGQSLPPPTDSSVYEIRMLTDVKVMKSFHLRVATIPAMAMCILAGCRVGPVYHQPAATAQAPPAAYKETPSEVQDSGDWKVAQPQDAMLRGKWWEIYNEPELNDLEEKLNIDNQNIKQFFQNFMEARTLISQARSQLYPTLAAAPSFTRSRASGNLGSTANGNITGGQQSSITSLPLTASWEPDLWGKVRNTIREAQYNAQLSAADLENERLTEQATLAQVYFEVRGQDALQALYLSTVAAYKKSYDIAEAGYDAGVTGQITVVEAQNSLQNAESALTNLGVARAQYEHAIAVLIGVNPSGFSVPVKALTTMPPPIPIGMPSQLLERRPDVAGSERAMAAANAQIGVAVAAFYPNLTLSAEGGLESTSISHLIDWPSRFWSVGPAVSETIFDAGLRRATVNQYIATYNADVAGYRQTVLTKFVELETGRYDTGIDPYVNVVTAQTTLLSDQQSLASLHTQQMTASVQLIEALGGGWDRSQLPTPADASKKIGKLAIEK